MQLANRFLYSHAQKLKYMIIVPVKEDSIDKALRKFKKKFEKTGVVRQLRSRQGYEKKSVTRRNTIKKAIFRNKLQNEDFNSL